jgi:acyl carrier protein
MEHERDRGKVLETVAGLVREVMGVGEGVGPSIGLETTFNGDLELESIEFVALAEKLQERYGQSVDFAGWLSGKELDAILALKVGDLVDLVMRSP